MLVDSTTSDHGPRDVRGYDPKKRALLKVRYTVIGLGVILLVFLVVGGVMGLLGDGAPDAGPQGDSSMANIEVGLGGTTAPKDSDKSAQDNASLGPAHYVNGDPAQVPLGSNWIVRVSAGATEDYIDPSGNVWLADHVHNQAKYSKMFTVQTRADSAYQACPRDIANADYAGQGLYCSERLFEEGTKGGYEVMVPDEGVYEISLHFAEIYFDQPGQRIFDVLVEGRTIHSNFDIVQQSEGNGNTAVRIQTTQLITDGAVSIELRARTQNAKISGWEVSRVADLP